MVQGKLNIHTLNAETRLLLPCIKINSNWIKYLNVRSGTLKQLEENIGEILQDTGTGNHFLRTPIAQEIKVRTDKWDYIKLKSFCTANNRMKRQSTK